jgi:hypothetical protein
VPAQPVTVAGAEQALGVPSGPDDVRRLVRMIRDVGVRSPMDHDDVPSPVSAFAATDLAARRAEAVRLEEAIERLRAKRRRAKRRLAEDRERMRDEQDALRHEIDVLTTEVQRQRELAEDAVREQHRVLGETETMVARLAGDAAARLERAALDEEMIRRALRTELDRAGRDVASLEADVGTVAAEAAALRSRLASQRSRFESTDSAAGPDD